MIVRHIDEIKNRLSKAELTITINNIMKGVII